MKDNRSLKEQNDELNGQIINLSIQGAKNLMSASFSDSLAAEINSVSRSEVGLHWREVENSTYIHENPQLTTVCLIPANGGDSQTGGDQLQTPGLH